MKLSKLQSYININPENIEVNPTAELEQHFFGITEDYREKAIDFSIQHQLPVLSTFNNVYTLVSRYIKFECPKCHEVMSANGGGGNSDMSITNFFCETCKVKASLTIPNMSGIEFSFEKEER